MLFKEREREACTTDHEIRLNAFQCELDHQSISDRIICCCYCLQQVIQEYTYRYVHRCKGKGRKTGHHSVIRGFSEGHQRGSSSQDNTRLTLSHYGVPWLEQEVALIIPWYLPNSPLSGSSNRTYMMCVAGPEWLSGSGGCATVCHLVWNIVYPAKINNSFLIIFHWKRFEMLSGY